MAFEAIKRGIISNGGAFETRIFKKSLVFQKKWATHKDRPIKTQSK
jgi:hypothetical protein